MQIINRLKNYAWTNAILFHPKKSLVLTVAIGAMAYRNRKSLSSEYHEKKRQIRELIKENKLVILIPILSVILGIQLYRGDKLSVQQLPLLKAFKCTITANPKITAVTSIILGGLASSYRSEASATWERIKKKGAEYSHYSTLGVIALLLAAIEYNRSEFRSLSLKILNLYQQATHYHKTTAFCLFTLGYLSQKLYEERIYWIASLTHFIYDLQYSLLGENEDSIEFKVRRAAAEISGVSNKTLEKHALNSLLPPDFTISPPSPEREKDLIGQAASMILKTISWHQSPKGSLTMMLKEVEKFPRLIFLILSTGLLPHLYKLVEPQLKTFVKEQCPSLNQTFTQAKTLLGQYKLALFLLLPLIWLYSKRHLQIPGFKNLVSACNESSFIQRHLDSLGYSKFYKTLRTHLATPKKQAIILYMDIESQNLETIDSVVDSLAELINDSRCGFSKEKYSLFKVDPNEFILSCASDEEVKTMFDMMMQEAKRHPSPIIYLPQTPTCRENYQQAERMNTLKTLIETEMKNEEVTFMFSSSSKENVMLGFDLINGCPISVEVPSLSSPQYQRKYLRKLFRAKVTPQNRRLPEEDFEKLLGAIQSYRLGPYITKSITYLLEQVLTQPLEKSRETNTMKAYKMKKRLLILLKGKRERRKGKTPSTEELDLMKQLYALETRDANQDEADLDPCLPKITEGFRSRPELPDLPFIASSAEVRNIQKISDSLKEIFIGREKEIDAILEAVVNYRSNAPEKPLVILLNGAPGTGKTALATEIGQRLGRAFGLTENEHSSSNCHPLTMETKTKGSSPLSLTSEIKIQLRKGKSYNVFIINEAEKGKELDNEFYSLFSENEVSAGRWLMEDRTMNTPPPPKKISMRNTIFILTTNMKNDEGSPIENERELKEAINEKFHEAIESRVTCAVQFIPLEKETKKKIAAHYLQESLRGQFPLCHFLIDDRTIDENILGKEMTARKIKDEAQKLARTIDPDSIAKGTTYVIKYENDKITAQTLEESELEIDNIPALIKKSKKEGTLLPPVSEFVEDD